MKQIALIVALLVSAPASAQIFTFGSKSAVDVAGISTIAIRAPLFKSDTGVGFFSPTSASPIWYVGSGTPVITYGGVDSWRFSSGSGTTAALGNLGVWGAGNGGGIGVQIGTLSGTTHLGVRWTTSQGTLTTCALALEGSVVRQGGAAGSGIRTKLCMCTSDGAASPVYAWQNLASAAIGTTTTCP